MKTAVVVFEATVEGKKLTLQPSDGDWRVPGLTVEGLIGDNIGILVIPFCNETVRAHLLGLKEGDRVRLTGHRKEGHYPLVMEVDGVSDVV